MQSKELIWIEWFKPKHAEAVKKAFEGSLAILRSSELLIPSLKEWLREEIASEVESKIPDQEKLAEYESNWWKKQVKGASDDEGVRLAFLESKFLTPELLAKQFQINQDCREWAQKTWASSLSQLFIDQKDSFDEVTFKLMRIPSEKKLLASEIYHRIKAKESEFEKLAMEFGCGPERFPGGCLNKLTLNMPQPQLAARLKRMNPNELSMPFPVAEWLVIVEMVSTRPAKLDDQITSALLDKAFEKFLLHGSRRLADALCKGTL